MTDDIAVKRFGVGWPAPTSPPAYHLPSWGWPILRQHRALCDDCEYIVEEAHDCPSCECEDAYWSSCDTYWRLYRESQVPTLDADGRHLTERDVWRRIVQRMHDGMRAALVRAFDPAEEPT